MFTNYLTIEESLCMSCSERGGFNGYLFVEIDGQNFGPQRSRKNFF